MNMEYGIKNSSSKESKRFRFKLLKFDGRNSDAKMRGTQFDIYILDVALFQWAKLICI